MMLTPINLEMCFMAWYLHPALTDYVVRTSLVVRSNMSAGVGVLRLLNLHQNSVCHRHCHRNGTVS